MTTAISLLHKSYNDKDEIALGKALGLVANLCNIHNNLHDCARAMMLLFVFLCAKLPDGHTKIADVAKKLVYVNKTLASELDDKKVLGDL